MMKTGEDFFNDICDTLNLSKETREEWVKLINAYRDGDFEEYCRLKGEEDEAE